MIRRPAFWRLRSTPSRYATVVPARLRRRPARDTLVNRPQRLDPLEERTDGEPVSERLLVLIAGHPDLLTVGSVQPGVVPHNRPGRDGLAPLGRADRWALLAAHRASLTGGRDLQPGQTCPSSVRSRASRLSLRDVVRHKATREARAQVLGSPEAEPLAEYDLPLASKTCWYSRPMRRTDGCGMTDLGGRVLLLRLWLTRLVEPPPVQQDPRSQLTQIRAGLEASKVRLTGGEPLLRRDLEVLASLVASTLRITDVALTTRLAARRPRAEPARRWAAPRDGQPGQP